MPGLYDDLEGHNPDAEAELDAENADEETAETEGEEAPVEEAPTEPEPPQQVS